MGIHEEQDINVQAQPPKLHTRNMLEEALATLDPEGDPVRLVYLVSNRGGGKTYPCVKKMMEIVEQGRKIVILCQHKQDLGTVARGVLDIYVRQHYPDHWVRERTEAKNQYNRIVMVTPENAEIEIGYVVAIPAYKKIKEDSSRFWDVDFIFLDEFQGPGWTDEDVENVMTIYTSIARGLDDTVARPVLLVMCSNSLSVESPFFRASGISRKIRPDTKCLRWRRSVFLKFFNRPVAEELAKNGVYQMFPNSRLAASDISNEWLNDDYTLVCKPGKSWRGCDYIATIYSAGEGYGVRYYDSPGVYYISRSVDETGGPKMSMGSAMENIPIIRSTGTWMILREALLMGTIRFSDLAAKNLFVDAML